MKSKGRELYHYKGSINEIEDVEDFDKQKEKILIFLNQEFQNKKLNIFIGSGCSVPAIPLMGATIENIVSVDVNIGISKKIDEYIELQNKRLNSKEQLEKESFGDIESFLTWLGKGIDFEKDETIRGSYQKIYDSLKTHFMATIPRFDDEKYTTGTLGNYINFYQYIFSKRKEESPKLNVFTTNYDLFNEYAFEKCKIRYTTGFDTGLNQNFNINQFSYRLVDSQERYKDRWQPTSKEANLYKLHGSINWVEKSNNLVQNNEASEDTENIIIYPTALKHQETRQSPYSELFRELSVQLQKSSSTLVILGYGFGDDHINNIISQNLNNSDFTLIVFGDVNEKGLKKFKELNQPSNFHIIGGKTTECTEKCEARCCCLKAHWFSEIISHFINNQGEEGKDNE